MQAERLSVQLSTRPRGRRGDHPPCACASMVADVELRADTRTPRRAEAVPELGRQLVLPPLLGALQARVSRALRGGGGGLRAATTGRSWIPPPLPVHLVHRALPRTTGRAPPAGRSAHREGGFLSTSTNALITNMTQSRAKQETKALARGR